MGNSISFYVPGVPAPQGSKRHVGKGILVESSKAVGPWRERVALAAHQAMTAENLAPFTGPVKVDIRFIMPRPKSAPKRFIYASKRPDLDKLVRACLDSITAIVLVEDSQVVELRATKELMWGDIPNEVPGCFIEVRELQ